MATLLTHMSGLAKGPQFTFKCERNMACLVVSGIYSSLCAASVHSTSWVLMESRVEFGASGLALAPALAIAGIWRVNNQWMEIFKVCISPGPTEKSENTVFLDDDDASNAFINCLFSKCGSVNSIVPHVSLKLPNG